MLETFEAVVCDEPFWDAVVVTLGWGSDEGLGEVLHPSAVIHRALMIENNRCLTTFLKEFIKHPVHSGGATIAS